MKIVDVICSRSLTGFYFDDQRAIKNNAVHEGFTYAGTPITPGFKAIRQAGEAVSVTILLEDGQVAYGDCAAVQYSGAGGRDPVFLADDFIPVIEQQIRPRLLGRELSSFKALAEEIDSLADANTGKRIHTALRYGVTQAILDAVAKAKHQLMCEVIADEYNTTVSDREIPIFTQSGDDRYDNADKMIIKGAQVLPHALINNVKEKLGEKGELLLDYVTWLKNRVLKLRTDEAYLPTLHIDVLWYDWSCF
ncbi:MAG: methylaspartate ammonia-lyase [Sporomusaceae bacterium]|nr:methylaspartate ammonia-lyase [Sporomusaceae bacterium]